MNIRQHCIIIILYTVTAAWCGLAHVRAANDDGTGGRILDDMRRHFNSTHEDSMYQAAETYREYYLKEGNMHNFYKGWQAEIMYDINFNHFYRAMRKTVEMSQDMRGRQCSDELYNATFLIGVIYSLQGNTYLAKDYFHKALQEAGEQTPVNLIQIYKDLANVEMDDDPEAAMRDLDHAIKIIRDAGLKYEYSDAIGFKVIVAFFMRDWQAVNRLYDEYMGLREEYGNEFSTTYYRYVMICRHAAVGNYREAVAWTDSLTNIDKYKFRSMVCEIAGDTPAALGAMKAYIHAKDSANSINIVQDLNSAANEIEMAAMKIKADEARTMRTAVWITTAVALAVIIMLTLVIRKRNGYMEKLRQKNRDLEILRDKAEESERMKANILKNMSHEVRTPLNIIAGFAQIISQPDFNLTPEERADIADRVTSSSDNLVKITNDLLYVASKESVNYTARTDDVSCNAVCRKAIDACRRILPEEIATTFDSTLDDSFTIRTNGNGLERILDSLLDNARKFTERGSIDVTCRYDNEGKTVTVAISDTGCGIPPENCERIFDLFYKIDNSRDGLGLGLPLARRIARQLGGDITLDTGWKDGTRFVLTLPG